MEKLPTPISRCKQSLDGLSPSRHFQRMPIFDILGPILLLVVLGVVLARTGFLGAEFIGRMSEFTFRVALPAALFHAAAQSGDPDPRTLGILAALLSATLLAAVAGWIVASMLGLPGRSSAALSQGAFRGNLAYVGLPMMAYAFDGQPNGDAHFAAGVVVMAVATSFFNILAVVVLQSAHQRLSWASVRPGLESIAKNPLLIACVSGLVFNLAGGHLPMFLDRTFSTLGAAAVPMALLTIGGSIAFIKLGARVDGMAAAAALKLVFLPGVVFVLGRAFALPPDDMRIALILAGCPTAAAAFVMAREMDADASLASGSIVLSTIFSALTLPLVLWISR